MPLHNPRGALLADELIYQAHDLVRPVSRPPVQTGKMTLKKLTALIRAGYGQGHLHRYKPWLRVTKRDFSPVSLIGHLPLPEQQRLQHFRALAERSVMLLVRWLGAVDARDQLPFWPWPHEHPLIGLPGIGAMPSLRGLEAIARDVNIEHGVFVGTTVPYVATIDVMVTWPTRNGGFVLSAYDCKPKAVVKDAPPGSRIRERIELHHRYCAEAGVHYRLTHAEKLPRDLMVNLDALYPILGPGQMEVLRRADDYRRVIESMAPHAYACPAYEALEAAAAQHGVAPDRARLILHSALWNQDLDHDLREPLELWEPLQPGGQVHKKALRREWAAKEAFHA